MRGAKHDMDRAYARELERATLLQRDLEACQVQLARAAEARDQYMLENEAMRSSWAVLERSLKETKVGANLEGARLHACKRGGGGLPVWTWPGTVQVSRSRVNACCYYY